MNGGKKISVCHISFSEFPADGRIKRYVNALINEGIFVVVICKSDPFHNKKELTENLYVRRLNVQKKRGNYISRTLEYVLFFVKASVLALYYFFKFRIKLYHTHTLPDFVSLTAFVPRLFGAEVILDLHEFTPEILILRKNITEKHWLVRLSKLVEKISVWCADELITIHDGVVELIGSRNKRQMLAIINGVEKDEYAGFERIKTDEFNIVYNGTINDSINLEDVVYALAVIRDKIPEPEFNRIKFNLYGTGPALEFILGEAKKHKLEKSVIYKGKVPYTQMIQELQKMSVCVLPFHRTLGADLSYPIKVPEMVNLRIPLIISRINTVLKFYPEECFFYFDAGDVAALAEQILKVKNNAALTEEKAGKAIEAYERISWEKVMKPQYLDLVRKLINKPR
jgi:glycosyltransferase involved in cell wall biosynthesis